MTRSFIAAAAAAVAAFAFAAPAPVLAGESVAATPAANPAATPAVVERVTAIGDARRGSMVTLEGAVQRIVDTDEFVLADATGDIRVDVGYPNFVPVAEGERVKVRGFIDRGLFREVYAREIVHADGRVSRLDRRGDDR